MSMLIGPPSVAAPSSPAATPTGPAVSLALAARTWVVAGTPMDVKVTARDARGSVATGYRGTVTFSSTDPRGPALPGAYRFTSADKGVHTFTGVTLHASGSRTITATDIASRSVTGTSAPIRVSHGPAVAFAATAPSTATAGAPFSVKVSAKDAWGNLDTAFRGIVEFTSTDPKSPTLPENYAYTAADLGTHVFDGVTLFAAGQHRVSVDDLAQPPSGATAPITVTGNVATHLSVAAPVYATAGSLYPVGVTALDAWNNTARSYRGTVSLTTSDVGAGASISPARYTFTAANAGVATFGYPAGVRLVTPGTRAVAATDTTRPSVAGSTAVKVTSAPMTGGALAGWGFDGPQLGLDHLEMDDPLTVPTTSDGDARWATVAAAWRQSVGIAVDGTLWGWGLGSFGYVGDGNFYDQLRPVQLGADTHWASVAAGRRHILAVKNDGTLWSWGNNGFGQLGDHYDQERNVPTQVGYDASWAAVAAGESHSLGVRTDGTLWAWGLTGVGQLGLGETDYVVPVPTQVGTGATWVAVAAGSEHSLAIASDGSLWAWGGNTAGQLGDGTTTNRSTPVRIGTGTSWTAVSAGNMHSVALSSDGSLWAWGDNSQGQVGDGTTVDRAQPVRIGGGTLWSMASAGWHYTLGIQR
jgi:hypothetical protein